MSSSKRDIVCGCCGAKPNYEPRLVRIPGVGIELRSGKAQSEWGCLVLEWDLEGRGTKFAWRCPECRRADRRPAVAKEMAVHAR